MKLDKKDIQILRILQQNSRVSLKKLARKTSLPVTTVFNRIKKFEQNGLIKDYKAIIDPKKVGLDVTAFILVAYDTSSKKSQRGVAKEISKLPFVQEVHIITGEWDMLLKVRGKNSEEIGKFVLDKLREIEGVLKTVTVVVFETVKETTELPLIHGYI
ncbi:MAG: Lrp/AsnC family transcriptional regulator [Candidatus Heimdallarchaeaceae archaeon]